MYNERPIPVVVVGAAIVAGQRVLACARSDRPEAGARWEFPGGKVEPGEAEAAALARECHEELGVRIEVGARVGPDVPLDGGRAVLRVYTASLRGADQPKLIEHREMRWLAADELFDVWWLPADVPVAQALQTILATAGAGPRGAGETAGWCPAAGQGTIGDMTELTYPEVGATRGDDLPPGYRHVRRHERLGAGVEVFRRAAAGLRGWDMQRGAGLRVPASTPPPAPGVRVTMSAAFLRIPCQVVWVVDEARRYGFGYGALPGHPEVGEEAFVLHLDDADQVWLDIRAFSRPGRWYTRLAGPLGWLVQDLATGRYVAAMRRLSGSRGA